MAEKKLDEFGAPEGEAKGAASRVDAAAEAANQAALAAEATNRDETVSGGRYKVNGILVNAEGEPVTE